MRNGGSEEERGVLKTGRSGVRGSCDWGVLYERRIDKTKKFFFLIWSLNVLDCEPML